MTIEERYAHWRDVIETQKTSGMTIAEYCRSRDIRTNAFYAWRRRISKRQTSGSGFLELRSPVLDMATGVRIVTAAGFYIDVSRGFDPSILRAVLSCMEPR